MGHIVETSVTPFAPSLTRGALFEKTAPLDPPQKLFIKPEGFDIRPENKFLPII